MCLLEEGSPPPSEACRYEYRSYSLLAIIMRRSGRRFNRFSEDTHLASLGLELTPVFECACYCLDTAGPHCLTLIVPKFLL